MSLGICFKKILPR